jgi:hypothetical protein
MMSGGQFGSGAMSGLKTYGSSIPGFKGIGTDNPTGALAKFITPNRGVASSTPTSSLAQSSGSNMAQQRAKVQQSLGMNPNAVTLEPITVSKFSAPSTPSSSIVPTQSAGLPKQSLMSSFLPQQGGGRTGRAADEELTSPLQPLAGTLLPSLAQLHAPHAQQQQQQQGQQLLLRQGQQIPPPPRLPLQTWQRFELVRLQERPQHPLLHLQYHPRFAPTPLKPAWGGTVCTKHSASL